MENGETSSSKSWDVGGPLGRAGLESWDEEEESREVENILGGETKPSSAELLWQKWNSWRAETETKDGVRKRVENGMDWRRKENYCGKTVKS